MKNKSIFIATLTLFYFTVKDYAQSKDMFISKLTAINTASYTDVVFVGSRDTALVSTFSGRISLIVNGASKEKVLTNLRDEIYSLAYNPKKKEIAASTLESGIIIVKQQTGAILKTLKLKTTWSVNIFYSDNCHYLLTHDQKGNRYIWDATNQYKEITLSTKVPQGRIIKLDSLGLMTIVSPKKITVWDFKKEIIVKETEVQLIRFGDMDKNGNILSVDFNVCAKYNTVSKRNEFVVKHPNWLRDIKDYPGYKSSLKQSPEDFTPDGLLIMNGYSMQLTMVRFAKNKIYTASIDRSIRVWDKESGNMIASLTGHKATVNKIKVNASETQLVSIDLKGGIKFWDTSAD